MTTEYDLLREAGTRLVHTYRERYLKDTGSFRKNAPLYSEMAEFNAALTSAPAAAEPVHFEGYLCKAWGETELPCAEVVADLVGVRRFIVREWLNDEKAEDLPAIMADIEASIEQEKAWFVQFEIGGASVEPVYSYTAPQPAQPAPQAGAADRPNPMSREQIRSVLMAHGYTVKPGQTDLKPYVYEAAEELICLGRELLDAHPTEQPSQDAERWAEGYDAAVKDAKALANAHDYAAGNDQMQFQRPRETQNPYAARAAQGGAA